MSPRPLDAPAPMPAGDTPQNGTTPPSGAAGPTTVAADHRPPTQAEPRYQPAPPPVAQSAQPATAAAGQGPSAPATTDPRAAAPQPGPQATQAAQGPTPAPQMNGGQPLNAQCTAPQLRRFIKSRPYVPMHELRRRFGIDGGDDVVTPVRLEPGWVYVGLPMREGGLLGELLKAGEIGYELSLDPRTPIVIGIYPMRPIPRN